MAKKNPTLSVSIATYNEERNLAKCLESVSDWVNEIVVVDGGSTDTTVSIARKYGAKVVQTSNPPIFHINKQKAVDAATGDWILQLDADEVVDLALKEEIMQTITRTSDVVGYMVPRRNYFLGDWLRKGGQYPDFVIRLFKHGFGSFPSKSVHEQIAIEGAVGRLKNPLDHYSYISVGQYWSKAKSYIALQASELSRVPRWQFVAIVPLYVVIKPVYTFLLLYIRHKGFLDGWRGLLFAMFSSLHFPLALIRFATKLQ